MAYSPSVQYGYYKRLESSLIVFFFSIFLFFKVGFFFFATLEKVFEIFFLYKIPSTQTLIQLSLWLEWTI